MAKKRRGQGGLVHAKESQGGEEGGYDRKRNGFRDVLLPPTPRDDEGGQFISRKLRAVMAFRTGGEEAVRPSKPAPPPKPVAVPAPARPSSAAAAAEFDTAELKSDSAEPVSMEDSRKRKRFETRKKREKRARLLQQASAREMKLADDGPRFGEMAQAPPRLELKRREDKLSKLFAAQLAAKRSGDGAKADLRPPSSRGGARDAIAARTRVTGKAAKKTAPSALPPGVRTM
jgi:hypothetical protein